MLRLSLGALAADIETTLSRPPIDPLPLEIRTMTLSMAAEGLQGPICTRAARLLTRVGMRTVH